MQLGGLHAATPPSAAPASGRAGGPLWRLPPRGANPGRARRAPGPMLEADGREFSERWGYLSRAGLNDKSCLTRQIEKYADIYTSRVSNFLQYTCGPPASRARLPRSARHPFNLGGMGNPFCAVHMLRILDRARYSSCSLCIRQRSRACLPAAGTAARASPQACTRALLVRRPYMYFRSPSQSVAHDCRPDAVGGGAASADPHAGALAAPAPVPASAVGRKTVAAAAQRRAGPT